MGKTLRKCLLLCCHLNTLFRSVNDHVDIFLKLTGKILFYFFYFYLEAGLKWNTTRVGLGTITVFDVYKRFGLEHS